MASKNIVIKKKDSRQTHGFVYFLNKRGYAEYGFKKFIKKYPFLKLSEKEELEIKNFIKEYSSLIRPVNIEKHIFNWILTIYHNTLLKKTDHKKLDELYKIIIKYSSKERKDRALNFKRMVKNEIRSYFLKDERTKNKAIAAIGRKIEILGSIIQYNEVQLLPDDRVPLDKVKSYLFS